MAPGNQSGLALSKTFSNMMSTSVAATHDAAAVGLLQRSKIDGKPQLEIDQGYAAHGANKTTEH